MGCCSSNQSSLNIESIKLQIRNAIEVASFLKLKILVNQWEKLGGGVDQVLLESKEISLNCLSYAIWKNQPQVFTFIYESLHPSIIAMEKMLFDCGMSTLDLIVQNNCFEILSRFIPIYMDNQIAIEHLKDSLPHDAPPQIYTPVHKACELGNISLISTIFNYFQKENHSNVPKALDVNFQSEVTGENCALIACRNCNFIMIKFLHEVCSSNFKVTNSHKENAIHICLAGARRSQSSSSYECLQYLIETVKISPAYMFEESLLMASDIRTIIFLEAKLKGLGIDAKKKDLEKRNEIKQSPIPKTPLELDLDQKSHDQFSIKDYISSESEEENDTLILSMKTSLLHNEG
jgi:hypothetical protein